MKILLTGGTGQVGGDLHRLLMPLGDIVAPNRKQLNLSDLKMLRAKIQEWKPDLIINPAAYTNVDNAEDEYELAYVINMDVPRVMAEESARLKIPSIHYYTDYVFDGKKKGKYLEDDAAIPLNIYGDSKYRGELAIKDAMDDYTIFRTSWVYSDSGVNFVNTILRLANEKEKLNIINDQIGAPTSSKLIAHISVLAIYERFKKNDRILEGVYNLTAKGETSWYGYAKRILELAKQHGVMLRVNSDEILSVTTEQYQQKVTRPKNSRLDTARIEQDLKVSLPMWDECLELNLINNILYNRNRL